MEEVPQPVGSDQALSFPTAYDHVSGLNKPSDLEGEEPIFTLAVMAPVSELSGTLSAMSAERSTCL